MQRRLLRTLVPAVLLLWPGFAFAEPRVVVSDFKGSSGRSVRAAVVDVLEDQGVELVPPKKAAATAKASGAELDTESGRVRVAKKLRLQAFIQGKAAPSKQKKVQISITVFGGEDGMPAAEFNTVVAKSAISKEIKAKLWKAIGAVLNGPAPAAAPDPLEEVSKRPAAPQPEVAAAPTRARPPWRPQEQAAPPPPPPQEVDRENPPWVAAPQEEPAERPNDEALALETHADHEEPSTNYPSAFDIAVGARVGTRSFGYNDSLPGLRGYTLGPAPSIALHGHWYPGAHFSAGALAHIGLDLRAEMLVGVSSENTANQKFSTSSHAFGVGVRGRVPLDKFELAGVVGFGQHAFSLANANEVDPDVPDIVHNFIRAGLEGRWQIVQPIALQLRASYLAGLSLGELASKTWFPHATGNGIEAELSFQLSITRMFTIELAGGMQRYFMSLNPELNDPGVRGATARVAGGALDKYYSSRLGVIIRP